MNHRVVHFPLSRAMPVKGKPPVADSVRFGAKRQPPVPLDDFDRIFIGGPIIGKGGNWPNRPNPKAPTPPTGTPNSPDNRVVFGESPHPFGPQQPIQPPSQQDQMAVHNRVKGVEVTRPSTRLSDVKGQDDAMSEIAELIDIIRVKNWRNRKQIAAQQQLEEQREKQEEKFRRENERWDLQDDYGKVGGTLAYYAKAAGRGTLKGLTTLPAALSGKPAGPSRSEEEELAEKSQRMEALGNKIPKGVILHGPPGTGKTLTAQAIAGEVDANFFQISGSGFMESFVGTGAARVRDLFALAKEKARTSGKPSVIFIDEVDAFGGKRGKGGNDDERQQTLNEVLVQMDGFGKNENVMVIFATNRKDMLDPALLRPGRIDREVYIGLPDRKGRLDTLNLYIRARQTEPDLNLDNLATVTSGFSGAKLKNLIEVAADMAYKTRRDKISNKDLSEAFERILMGIAKPNLEVRLSTREQVAAHELGHGLATLACGREVFIMSMTPRDKSLGHVFEDPSGQDEFLQTRRSILHDMLILSAGRAAERALYGEDNISTGAGKDHQELEKLFRLLRTSRMLNDKKRVDYADPERKLSAEDEVLLSQMIEEAERVMMQILGLTTETQFRTMIADSLKAGTLMKDEAQRFFLGHLEGFDWNQARELVDGFVKNPIGSRQALRPEAEPSEPASVAV